MKKLLMISRAAFLAGPIVCATSAWAGDVTITVPDTFKATMQNTQMTFERCMGAIVSHGNTDTCSAVSNLLTQLGNLPTTPVPSPSPTPAASAPPPSPSPEAAKPAEAEKKTSGEGGKPDSSEKAR